MAKNAIKDARRTVKIGGGIALTSSIAIVVKYTIVDFPLLWAAIPLFFGILFFAGGVALCRIEKSPTARD